MPIQQSVIYNIAVIGDERVGKTAWITRLLEDKFSTNYVPTSQFGPSFNILNLKTANNSIIKIKLFETTNVQELTQTTNKIDYAIIMFDGTNKNTYNNTNLHYNMLKICYGVNIPILFVVNKNDKHIIVSDDDFVHPTVIISSQQKTNICEPFTYLFNDKNIQVVNKISNNSRRRNINIL